MFLTYFYELKKKKFKFHKRQNLFFISFEYYLYIINVFACKYAENMRRIKRHTNCEFIHLCKIFFKNIEGTRPLRPDPP